MPNELWIYDVIGESFWESGVTAKGVRDELAGLDKKERLLVRINSPGGSVFEAVSIHTQLLQWEAGVDIQIDGVAASAASYIATIGNSVTMADGAMIMIHEPWTMAVGNAAELLATVDRLNKLNDNIARAYSKKSSRPVDEIKTAMAAETWFTADEAIEFGLATEKIAEPVAAFAIPKTFGFKHAPEPAVIQPKQRSWSSIAAMQHRLDLARSI